MQPILIGASPSWPSGPDALAHWLAGIAAVTYRALVKGDAIAEAAEVPCEWRLVPTGPSCGQWRALVEIASGTGDHQFDIDRHAPIAEQIGR